jgi:uncharacterized Fe-S cluster protein YjdI
MRHVVHCAARFSADPARRSCRKFFAERFAELNAAAQSLASARTAMLGACRHRRSSPISPSVRTRLRARHQPNYRLPRLPPSPAPATPASAPPPGNSAIEPGQRRAHPRTVDGVDYIEGRDLTLIYEGRKCIHSRFCVTWGPKVFIANVKGPWINPEPCDRGARRDRTRVCLGAIRYKRKDGKPDEAAPP